MTRALAGRELAERIDQAYPDSVVDSDDTAVWIDPASLPKISRTVYEDSDLDFQFLTSVSAVDYVEYFELVYHLLSMRKNHSAVIKTRVYDREAPSVPSVIDVWRGADLQEREIWDLMGVSFDGHPNMKRVLLWEGFEGHPLRKDYLG